MIGIIGYGFVGRAVKNGFNCKAVISDPAYNNTSISDLTVFKPDAIFVCVPTDDGDNFTILKEVLDQLKDYQGLVIVKSTVLPDYIKDYNIVYNPEFLSRASADYDFIRPHVQIFGGNIDKCHEARDVHDRLSNVKCDNIFFTDIQTACMTKYAMNSFYAMKLTFMNSLYDAAKTSDVDYLKMIDILKKHPWMGTHHFQVPGPDGERGFGGPCLPKDTKALAEEYNIDLLNKVLELNEGYRNGSN